jgi:signal transduction histidine kinase
MLVRALGAVYCGLALWWLVVGAPVGHGARYPLAAIALDDVFSLALLALALVAGWHSGRTRGRRPGLGLLATGLVGAAAAFNVQAAAIHAHLFSLHILPWSLHGTAVAACVAGVMLLSPSRSRVFVAVVCAAVGTFAAAMSVYAPSLDFLLAFGLAAPLAVLLQRSLSPIIGAAMALTAALTLLLIAAGRVTEGLGTPGLLDQVPHVSQSGPVPWRVPPGLGRLGPQVSAFWVDRFVVVAAFAIVVATVVRDRQAHSADRLSVKVFVYPILVTLVGGVYVLGVVRVDASFGLDQDWLAPPQVAAASLVALALQPVRAGLERLADRVVYGRRLPRREVLARVRALSQIDGGGPEALRSLAEVTARTLGAESAAARVRLIGGESLVGRWPPRGRIPSGERWLPVTFQGEVVGALAIPDAPHATVPRSRRVQLRDLSRIAGVVLHNTALALDLQRRVQAERERSAEIRASRWRIVTAQDGERRDLERDLHDIAQPGMTSVRLALGLVNHRAGGADKEAYAAALEGLRGHITLAEAGLRQTVQGIEPPALNAGGLLPALRATADSLHLAIEFRLGAPVEGRRFDRLVETTVYGCCVEAMQNAAKHGLASTVTVRLDATADRAHLTFEVADDGQGFDPATVRASGSGLQNIADRLAAVGGRMAIDSRPGRGTAVSGSVPLDASRHVRTAGARLSSHRLALRPSPGS